VPSENTERRKLAAIMFTDMVGYSILSQRNEALALELLAENQRLLRTQFPLFNGREVKTTGDGFLIEFPSALQATQCAVEIQRAVVARNSTQPAERHIHVRIGIHVGDVVYREADMYGDGVNIAARIEPLAIGGGICLSDTVYAQVRNKLDVGLTKLNSPDLKHIEVPMDVYRVVLPWQQQAPVVAKSAWPSPSKPSARLVVGLAVALALGGAGWWLFHPPGQAAKQSANPQTNAPGSPAAAATTSATDQKSIAVLPFVNMSADKADEWVSDGMTEELLNVLAKVPGLHVPGRSSSFAFKGKTEEGIFRKVGEQLHVATVLEGSVRKAGDKLRITAQLINVADGFHLWSETYDRDMTNLFSVQSEVAHQVAIALKLQLGVADTQRLQSKPTANLAAYELYLKGRFNLYQYTDQTSKQAIDQFNQAITLDPAFAKAYAGLAAAYAWISSVYMPPKEAMPKAKGYVLKALELDESLADAHHSLATIKWWGDWDFPGAEREFKRSFELNPNEARVYWDYAHFLTTLNLNRADEVIKAAHKAEQLDLSDSALRLSWVYTELRRYDQAAEHVRRALKENTNSASPHATLAYACVRQGKFAEAIHESQKALQLSLAGDRGRALVTFATILALSGQKEEARRHLDEINQLAGHMYVSPVRIALLHTALGDRERAFEWLKTAYEGRSDSLLSMSTNPDFDSLRTDPRFTELLKKVGLEK
jgi:TolB-like protein/class 3 adenylate cyclase/tetratricopeptide (TPR) repeat protein